MLTQAKLQALFAYDPATGNLIRKTRTANSVQIGDIAGGKNQDGYIQIAVDSKPYMAHRLVWIWHGKELPQFIDHINRDKADNRIENLRPATRSENMHNKDTSKRSTSGYRGVMWYAPTKEWEARIMVDGQSYNLGRYKTAKEASEAYEQAKQEFFPTP